jgi:hypothetical protein
MQGRNLGYEPLSKRDLQMRSHGYTMPGKPGSKHVSIVAK